jgi:3-deoxy-D-manno-octulosonic-acid transferase
MKLLLTHGTATGRAEGEKLLRAGDVQVWQAWDTAAATEHFVQHFQPRIGIMMETELWPNMAATCAKHHVPLVMANARMSDKTYVQTKKFDGLARPAYESLAAVWPQSAADADRLAKLGARVAGVFGNLKFDALVDIAQLALGKSWRSKASKPVVIFAKNRLQRAVVDGAPPSAAV